jgi:putative transposase
MIGGRRTGRLNGENSEGSARPEGYAWSSAAAHLRGIDDGLVKVGPLLEMVGDWKVFLSGGIKEHEAVELRRSERTGRPLGSEGFVSSLEKALGRTLRPRKAGRNKNEK